MTQPSLVDFLVELFDEERSRVVFMVVEMRLFVRDVVNAIEGGL